MNIYATKHTFLENKYTSIYFKIVDKALSENRSRGECYYELHHILPKSIYPDYSNLKKNSWNGVLLTAREHFIAHILLCKMFFSEDATIRMKHALTAMAMNRGVKRYFNSRLFENFKGYRAPWNKGKKGIPAPKPKSFGECRKGEGNTFFGKKHNEESRRKISESRKNREPWNKGKKGLQKGSRKGVILEKTPCIHCGKEVSKTNMIRWHGDNCKMKGA